MKRIHSILIRIIVCGAVAMCLSGCGRDETPDPQSSDTVVESSKAASGKVTSNDSPHANALQTASPSSTGPEGIYLTNGGLGYFLIDRDDNGSLQGHGMLTGGDMFRVTQRGKNLVIESRIINPMFPGAAEARLWGGFMELTPSTERLGDWNLTRFRHPTVLLAAEMRGKTTAANSSQSIELPEPELWDMPSFLHRINDARVAEYFEYVADYRDTPQIQTQASQLLSAHPADPWVRILYLDACVRTGELDEMARRLTEWKPSFDPIAQPELRLNLQQADRVIKTHRRNLAGENAWRHITSRLLAPDADLAARTAALTALADFDFCEAPFESLNIQSQHNYLEGQLTAKVMLTRATLHLLEGRFDEARDTMTGVYRWGWLMEQSRQELPQLIGVAIRGMAISALETLALNAPLESPIAEANWNAINELKNARTGNGEASGPPDSGVLPTWGGASGNKELTIRRNTVEARLASLKVAAALRLFQAQSGTFPNAGVVMLENLTDWRMPADPFAPAADPSPPMRMAHETETGELTVYSLGPDSDDDFGAAPYDPTNGTVSDGDVLLRIPPERAIPFPAGGVRAASGDDVTRQFPHGLPRDVFSDTRSPLSVTSDAPVRVWSWGPDVNQGEAEGRLRLGAGLPGSLSIQTEEGFMNLDVASTEDSASATPYIPTIPYDPTNGLVSAGDIFIELPSP